MKKILALVMLLPLLSFLVVPVATVRASTGFDAEIYVSCVGSSYSASATLTYSGHTVSISCAPSTSYIYHYSCFVVHTTSGFTGSTTVDHVINSISGKMGPHFAPYGSLEFYSYGPDGDTYAYLYIGVCD
jgi:hypothetical protein